MTECDFAVELRILDASGALVLDLNDRAQGFTVETIAEPGEESDVSRASAPRVHGDSTVSRSRP